MDPGSCGGVVQYIASLTKRFNNLFLASWCFFYKFVENACYHRVISFASTNEELRTGLQKVSKLNKKTRIEFEKWTWLWKT